jgi:hypothetical protein
MNYVDAIAMQIRQQVPPEALPHGGDLDALFRIYAVLAMSKGAQVTDEDVHDAWSAWVAGHDPDHESLVPLVELDDEAVSADVPFTAAIKTVVGETGLVGLDAHLFPNGLPSTEDEHARIFELYKLMVTSSEALVGRRQGVNTFFLTINGALLTATGLILSSGGQVKMRAASLAVLTLTGVVLSQAWRSLIRSFGQLNKGKLAVINRIEQLFPAAIYLAEWKALGEGQTPSIYRTFTSREVWVPWTLTTIYGIATVAAALVAFGRWHLT